MTSLEKLSDFVSAALEIYEEDERAKFEDDLERRAEEKRAMLTKLVAYVKIQLGENKYTTEIAIRNFNFMANDSKLISVALQRLVRIETIEDRTANWITKIHLLQSFEELRKVVNRR